jgi:hypothetical protein
MTEYIQNNHFEAQKPKGKPSVITWQGVRMIRSQSIQAVAKELINMSANQEMVSINAIGKQGQGKTQLLFTISHLIHKHSKIPYQISYFGKEAMLNLEETVKNLKPTNQIIIFDDIAFLKASATTKQIDQIQQVLSVIRHLPGGKDVRIILMKSFQYSKSIPPFLRQNDVTFLASVDDNEIKNLEEMLGKKYHSKLKQLKFLRAQGAIGEAGKSNFVFDMGGGKKVTYGWMRPFLPFLYKTGVGCRIIVSPMRIWIDPICNDCAGTNNEIQDDSKDVKRVIDDFVSKFKDGNVIRTAVKIKLIQQGINAFSPRIVQAVKYIDRMQQEKLVSIEALASELELTPTKTLLFPNRQPEIKS